MSQRYQSAFGILALFWGAGAARANMIVTGPLQPNGDVGFVSSQSNSIVFGIGCPSGSNCQGSIYQMDGFVNVPDYDFGDGPGMSHQLTNGAPAGIGYTFNASQPTADQLLLTYTFINNTAQAL